LHNAFANVGISGHDDEAALLRLNDLLAEERGGEPV
jgi:hypothetical protein